MTRTVYQEAIASRDANRNHSELSKMQQYRLQLKSITNKLQEMAQTSGRANASCNQLLRECYQLTDTELDTFEGWTAKGGRVRKGQHAYLFWESVRNRMQVMLISRCNSFLHANKCRSIVLNTVR